MKHAFQLGRRLRPGVVAAVACAAAVAVAVCAAGCGQARSPSAVLLGARHRVVPGELSVISGIGPASAAGISAAARAQAVRQAEHLLADVRVPSGSRRVASLPGRLLTAPAVEPLCGPIEDDTLRWIVPLSAGGLIAFLTGHVRAAMTDTGSGTFTSHGIVTSYYLTESPRGHPAPGTEMVFTWISAGPSTELRADALTVPAGAACVNPGGPAVVARRVRPGPRPACMTPAGVAGCVNPGGLPTFVKRGSLQHQLPAG
jgi:hypothetical protein